MNTYDQPTYTLQQGNTPLLVSMPHVGTHIPELLTNCYTENALQLADTDWHLDLLYDFVQQMGVSMIVPRVSRYVIDLNRPPENTPMYTGSNNTELCPTRNFNGESIYKPGCAPDRAEIDQRRALYWQPYHDAVHTELARLRGLHGHATLFDAHSIRSVLPWLFDGVLPDLNLGTANATSISTSLRDKLAKVLERQTTFSHVVDGRFKGGYITRKYGQPAAGWHAVQLEMCWKCYMNESPPYSIDPIRSAQVLPVLKELVQTLIEWRPHE